MLKIIIGRFLPPWPRATIASFGIPIASHSINIIIETCYGIFQELILHFFYTGSCRIVLILGLNLMAKMFL